MVQGSTSSSVRLYNETIFIHSLRQNKKMTRAELGKMTSLSSQAVGMITENLAKRELIRKTGVKVTGIGQPSFLYEINPEGAYSIGFHLGRKILEVILVGFDGQMIVEYKEEYNYPDPRQVVRLIKDYIEKIKQGLSAEQVKRIIGIGVALPNHLDDWGDEVEVSRSVLDSWKEVDIVNDITKSVDEPVYCKNDVDAAALAENILGKYQSDNFLYIYVGTLIGGGVVVNGNVFSGRENHAGNIAVMPVPVGRFGRSSDKSTEQNKLPFVQLINRTSLFTLKKVLLEHGFMDIDKITDLIKWMDSDNEKVVEIIDQWVDDVGEAIALVCLSSVGLLDFERVVIDGSVPKKVVQKIEKTTSHYFKQLDTTGIVQPKLCCGTFEQKAKVMGSAILPLYQYVPSDLSMIKKTKR